MDNFIVSARKYRPLTFDSVVGQQHIIGTLKNAIRNKQLAQAFLFCGPRGVGKTTCARILAKTINCEVLTADFEACGECTSCKSSQLGNSFSIHELDAASNNSVDDMRNLIDQVRIPPQQGNYKVYIIDEVHMLSQQAFNAFLKTLEEPPPYAIFILATTEKHRILPTILSRCQIFDFNRISVEDMAQHLARIAEKEGIAYEYDGLQIIAQKADGGLRDALSMFDQLVSFSNKNVTYQAVLDNLNILDYDHFFKLTKAINDADASSALLMLDEILMLGFDGIHFIAGLATHFRNLLVAKDPKVIGLLEVTNKVKQQYEAQAADFDAGILLSGLNIANQCEINFKNSNNQRLQVELALLKMCHIRAAIKLDKQSLGESNAEPEKKKSTKEASVEPTIETPPKTESNTAANKLEKPLATPIKTNSWAQVKLGAGIDAIDAALAGNNSDQEQGETVTELIEGDAKQAIEYDNLLKEWHHIADQYKEENKINLFTLMTAHPPKLLVDSSLIEMIVENTVQQDLLLVSKPDIVNALRLRLNNYELDILPKKPSVDIQRKPYTAQEKYQAMVAKNPLLDTFRQELRLGLE